MEWGLMPAVGSRRRGISGRGLVAATTAVRRRGAYEGKGGRGKIEGIGGLWLAPAMIHRDKPTVQMPLYIFSVGA